MEMVTYYSSGLVDVDLLAEGAFYAIDNIGGSACETVGEFNRLGPVTLSVLQMKGTVLHLLRVQLKVPDDSPDFSVLLTKKSLKFLLCLNEMSAGSENKSRTSF